MKSFASISLMFIFFVQTFSTFIIQADFFVNRSYITRTLCVNKDKPMMHCNGKCYLSKKLKEQQPQGQPPASRTEKSDIQPFFIAEPFLINRVVVHVKPKYFLENENAVSACMLPVFHPPAASLIIMIA